MTNSAEITDASRQDASVESARMRFQGIVDSGEGSPPAEFRSFEKWAASESRMREDRVLRIGRLGRELETASRFVAILNFFVVIVGWPIGTLVGYR